MPAKKRHLRAARRPAHQQIRHIARVLAREFTGLLNNRHVSDEVLDLDERRATRAELRLLENW